MTQSPRPADQWTLRDAAMGLALANLSFLDVWANALPAAIGSRNLFFYKDLPSPAFYLAGIVNVTLLGLVLSLALSSVRLSGKARWPAGLLLVTSGLVALNALRFRLPAHLLGASVPAFAAAGALLLAALWMARRRFALRGLVEGVLLALAAFVPVTFLQAVQAVAPQARAPLAQPPLAGPLPSPREPATRVSLWLFDEWDYRVSFETGISMPTFERLRNEALWASNARPPGRATLISVPSLLGGEVATHREPLDTSSFAVRSDSGISAPWNGPQSLLHEIRSRGFNSSVSGWYLPYCRGFAAVLARCTWEFHLQERAGFTFADAIGQQWTDVFFTLPLTYKRFNGEGRVRQARIEQVQRIEADAVSALRDPGLHFTYVHMPVPHPPCLFDSSRGEYSSTADCDYESNLPLLNRIAGTLRQAMESANLWDSSAVIMTSDHPWRKAPVRDERVPLIIKMPRQRTGLVLERPIDTMILHRLIPALMEGHLRDLPDLEAWLARESGAAGGPVLGTTGS